MKKPFAVEATRCKRMYVRAEHRGKRYGETILEYIEREILENGVAQVVLETGILQKSAIQLYTRNGYQRIENYGQYQGKSLSVCMGKSLASR